MTSRIKSSLLWGVVAALCFVVLMQGYLLVVGELPVVGFGGMFGLAAVLGAAVAAVSYVTEHRLAAKGRT
ncbi:hypothetical protein ACNS7O_08060 [Haloferacaceae archaeon DSL9]